MATAHTGLIFFMPSKDEHVPAKEAVSTETVEVSHEEKIRKKKSKHSHFLQKLQQDEGLIRDSTLDVS